MIRFVRRLIAGPFVLLGLILFAVALWMAFAGPADWPQVALVGATGFICVGLGGWVGGGSPQRGTSVAERVEVDWRGRRPTRRQLDYARRLGVWIKPGMTRGELADAIDQAVAK